MPTLACILHHAEYFEPSPKRQVAGNLCHPSLAGQQDLVFEHGFIGKLSRSMWRSKFQMMPEILQKDVAFPILTLGNNGTGTSMHQHEGTWLLLMTGLKAWWIADGTTRTRSFGQRDPCQNLGTSLNDLPEGFQFCVQKAGELVCRA
jgi:hypothetical protein